MRWMRFEKQSRVQSRKKVLSQEEEFYVKDARATGSSQESGSKEGDLSSAEALSSFISSWDSRQLWLSFTQQRKNSSLDACVSLTRDDLSLFHLHLFFYFWCSFVFSWLSLDCVSSTFCLLSHHTSGCKHDTASFSGLIFTLISRVLHLTLTQEQNSCITSVSFPFLWQENAIFSREWQAKRATGGLSSQDCNTTGIKVQYNIRVAV